VEGNDRRYLCIESSPHRSGDHAYFDVLVKLQNKECGKHFFHFLAFRQRELREWDTKNIPMTQFRYNLMGMSIPSCIRFMLDYINTYWLGMTLTSDTYEFDFNKLYKEQYTDWCNVNLDTSAGGKTYGIVSQYTFKYYLKEVWNATVDSDPETKETKITFPMYEDEETGEDITSYATLKKAEKYFKYRKPLEDVEQEEEEDLYDDEEEEEEDLYDDEEKEEEENLYDDDDDDEEQLYYDYEHDGMEE
jgi:hypothetical protein